MRLTWTWYWIIFCTCNIDWLEHEVDFNMRVTWTQDWIVFYSCNIDCLEYEVELNMAYRGCVSCFVEFSSFFHSWTHWRIFRKKCLFGVETFMLPIQLDKHLFHIILVSQWVHYVKHRRRISSTYGNNYLWFGKYCVEGIVWLV